MEWKGNARWWMRARRSNGALGTLIVSLTGAGIARAQQAPVTAKIAFCEPNTDGDDSVGWGNRPSDRKIDLYIRYESPSRDLAQIPLEVAATSSIDVCSMLAPSIPTCTPMFNSTLTGNAPTEVALKNSLIAIGDSTVLRQTVDWDFLSGQGSFLRVNGPHGGIDQPPQAGEVGNGTCVLPQVLAQTDHFKAWGLQPAADPSQPFGTTGFDICTMSTAEQVYGSGPTKTRYTQNVCVKPDQAQYLANMMGGIDDAQVHRVQGNPLIIPLRASENGPSGDRAHIFISPNWAGGGTGGAADFRIAPDGIQCIDPLGDPSQNSTVGGLCGGGGKPVRGTLDLAAHEWFHVLVAKWSRTRPTSSPYINYSIGVTEGMAKSAEANLCVAGLPGTTASCVSGFDIGQARDGRGIFESTIPLLVPEMDVLEPPYDSALFWAYVYEQFSYPVGTSPHPSGTSSAVPRCAPPATCPSDPEAEAPLQGRHADEGVDFVGLFFDTAANATSTNSFFGVLDRALTTHLDPGREHCGRGRRSSAGYRDAHGHGPRGADRRLRGRSKRQSLSDRRGELGPRSHPGSDGRRQCRQSAEQLVAMGRR